jgi:hypothetical protein
MHDLMHAAHAELKVVKDGPLPGAAGEVHTGARSLREAAISRLRLKPYEVQRHVELLEAIKQELDRLVSRRWQWYMRNTWQGKVGRPRESTTAWR